ncbi:acyltransferase family protein [Paenibacillus sp. NPDC057967]|uniref:acyltransferase family protein n=1 Tax=Paenibacillus sp. NPDC057967 TaxID=3346293 RepID=UPI0036DDB407
MRKQNVTIQGLRGLLALLVVIFHSYSGLESISLIAPLQGPLQWIGSMGSVSVNLFFVISGYLILQSLTRHQNLKKFFIDRILRIYPVFVVIHLLIFMAGPIINYDWMSGISIKDYVIHFFSNLLLLPGIFPSLPEAQLVAWSISYEFLFYLLVGLVFGASINRSSSKSSLIIIVALIISVLFIYFHPRALFFIVGIILFKLIDKINEKVTYRPWFYFNGVILLGVILVTYNALHISISLLFSFLFFKTVINEEGLLSRVLRTKVFKFLGDISYSLYLWHTFVMFPLKIVILKISNITQIPFILLLIFTVLSISISVLVSHLSYHWIEQRFTKYIKSRIYRVRDSRTPLQRTL